MIINPAAYTAVDLAEDDRDNAFRINADAPRALAEVAARLDIPLIHFSTDYVFNGGRNAINKATCVPTKKTMRAIRLGSMAQANVRAKLPSPN